jgi:hypothetical protein
MVLSYDFGLMCGVGVGSYFEGNFLSFFLHSPL